MTQPYYLELDLPKVTEWLPDCDQGTSEQFDAWILREQALRWKPGQDRKSDWPSNELFEL
ncbi:MAG: hypothetical protein U0984_16255 [Prosthecobacter sp.]|nr:hypothetical protein [Prosthecobacter sp.]